MSPTDGTEPSNTVSGVKFRASATKPSEAKAAPTKSDHPYRSQPPKAFWRNGVESASAIEMDGVYTPRFIIPPEARISAAGSCFAQHIARQFKARGYNFQDFEPAPELLDAKTADEFSYGQYSARFENIYSVRQLVQLFARAYGQFEPNDSVWRTNERFFDPFRPTVQPGGFATEQECLLERQHHLAQVRRILPETDLFVFTFGLTEAWMNTTDGAILPTCPGTHAGQYDPDIHAFKNFRFNEVLEDAKQFIALAREHNPNMRFLFTVSPVPLTATATEHHVLPATVYSKSVLRAVCGELLETYDYVDYYPSYELVASHPMRGIFYRPNMRHVATEGVARVMDIFFRAQSGGAPMPTTAPTSAPRSVDEGDVSCAEEILEMFGE